MKYMFLRAPLFIWTNAAVYSFPDKDLEKF